MSSIGQWKTRTGCGPPPGREYEVYTPYSSNATPQGRKDSPAITQFPEDCSQASGSLQLPRYLLGSGVSPLSCRQGPSATDHAGPVDQATKRVSMVPFSKYQMESPNVTQAAGVKIPRKMMETCYGGEDSLHRALRARVKPKDRQHEASRCPSSLPAGRLCSKLVETLNPCVAFTDCHKNGRIRAKSLPDCRWRHGKLRRTWPSSMTTTSS